MKYIAESYRPIEVYLILRKSKVEFIDILLLLLLELLTKKILTVEYTIIRNKEHAGNIKIGENFKTYKYEPIDKLFLHPFIQDSNSVFNFQYILLKAIEKANSKNNLIRLAVKSTQLKEVLKQKLLLSLFGIVRLNKNSKELAIQIEEEIVSIRQRLRKLMKNSETNRIEIVNLICNRIYFIDGHSTQNKFNLKFLISAKDHLPRNYEIKHELRIEYFKRRLQLAHVELLKMDHNMKLYEIERNGEGMD